jgi:hypothetical protein
MAVPDTTKPATEPVNGFHSVEQLAGELDHANSDGLPEIQARSLRRHFAVSYCLAASLVPLIWGAGPR